jgi:hypothetical protein
LGKLTYGLRATQAVRTANGEDNQANQRHDMVGNCRGKSDI